MNPERHILIVDDIESIRVAIRDYLSSIYRVWIAENAQRALEILAQYHIDMIISDIRMPDMDGITLLRKVQKLYPETKYALITAYNVNDYIQYAREYKIWNIIPKSSFLNLQFIKTMVYKLLTDDIFGFEKYFSDIRFQSIKISDIYKQYKDKDFYLKNRVYYQIKVQSEEERSKVCELSYELLKRHQAPTVLRLLLEELSMNARDYGSENFTIPIQLGFGIYDSQFLISVKDYRGVLNFDEVLYRLERNVTLDSSGYPLSIYDERGRGLFIVRENLDHLIINICEGVETEILGILEATNQFRNKSISLYKIKKN